MKAIKKVQKALSQGSASADRSGIIEENDGLLTATCDCGATRNWLVGPRAEQSARRWLSRHTHRT